MRAAGSSIVRNDATPKVTGTALYPSDINLPNQAWLKVVFAGVPHARVRAVHVDAAQAAPGVLTVLTAADVPVNEYGLIMFDQPVICGVGSTPQAELVRWEADCIAVVVAESMAQAEAAARLVTMEYDPLPLLTDPLEAMQPGAYPLHPYPFKFPYGERDTTSNVLLEYYLIDGDIGRWFCAGRCRGRGDLSHAGAGARLPAARSGAGAPLARWPRGGDLRRAVDA